MKMRSIAFSLYWTILMHFVVVPEAFSQLRPGFHCQQCTGQCDTFSQDEILFCRHRCHVSSATMGDHGCYAIILRNSNPHRPRSRPRTSPVPVAQPVPAEATITGPSTVIVDGQILVPQLMRPLSAMSTQITVSCSFILGAIQPSLPADCIGNNGLVGNRCMIFRRLYDHLVAASRLGPQANWRYFRLLQQKCRLGTTSQTADSAEADSSQGAATNQSAGDTNGIPAPAQ